jgi:hypothetical protein
MGPSSASVSGKVIEVEARSVQLNGSVGSETAFDRTLGTLS